MGQSDFPLIVMGWPYQDIKPISGLGRTGRGGTRPMLPSMVAMWLKGGLPRVTSGLIHYM